MPVARTFGVPRPVLSTLAFALMLVGAPVLVAHAQTTVQAPRPQPAPQPAAPKPPEPALPEKPETVVFPLTTLWTIHLDTAPALPPAYDDLYAYVVLKPDADRGISAARLTAVALSNGSAKWTREVGAVETLAAGAGRLFASAGSTLEAFSTADGAPQWQAPLGAPLSAPPLVTAGWLVAVTQASEVLALRALDGARVWQAHLPSPATGRPAIAGDGLYVPVTDNRVLRLKVDSGAVVWDRKILAPPIAVLALDDRIFVGTRQRWFYALRPADGRVLWRFAIGGAVAGEPAADASSVYFLTLDNLLRALDRNGGPLEWRQMLARRERFGPLPAGGLLFVSGYSATVQAFNAKTGAPAGSFDAPRDLLNMPVHLVRGLIGMDFLLIALTGEGDMIATRPHALDVEPFAVSGRVLLMAGFPAWRY